MSQTLYAAHLKTPPPKWSGLAGWRPALLIEECQATSFMHLRRGGLDSCSLAMPVNRRPVLSCVPPAPSLPSLSTWLSVATCHADYLPINLWARLPARADKEPWVSVALTPADLFRPPSLEGSDLWANPRWITSTRCTRARSSRWPVCTRVHRARTSSEQRAASAARLPSLTFGLVCHQSSPRHTLDF